MAFSTEFWDFSGFCHSNKTPLARHGHSCILGISAVTIMTGYLVLSMPARLPILDNHSVLLYHGIRRMTADTDIFLKLFACPWFREKLFFKNLFIICSSNRWKNQDCSK